MTDTLGDRMKAYEACTQSHMPRRTHTIIRIDGRAFHTLTRKVEAKKPYDADLIAVMNETALVVVKEVSGAVLAYVQSDEISVLCTDFHEVGTQAWFGGNVQKHCSVSASIATAQLNKSLATHFPTKDVVATCDSRVFTVPDAVEVYNYFLWRLRDWERNSIQMMARASFSHKELHGKSTRDMHEMLHGVDKNWALLPDDIKRGRLICVDPNYDHLSDDEKMKLRGNRWRVVPMFRLPEDKELFQSLIPTPGY